MQFLWIHCPHVTLHTTLRTCSIYTQYSTHNAAYTQWCKYSTIYVLNAVHTYILQTQHFTHTAFYTHNILHTQHFTHTAFYTHNILHTQHFTHTAFYTHSILHTQHFTHNSLHTWQWRHNVTHLSGATLRLNFQLVVISFCCEAKWKSILAKCVTSN